MSTPREGARELLANLRSAYSTPHTIVPVNESAFSHLDLAAYRQFRVALEEHGYRFLSDVEAPELTNKPGALLARTMSRCMISADGGTVANCYLMPHRFGRLLGKLLVGFANLRFIDASAFFLRTIRTRQFYAFESEVAGTFVTTSNTAGAAPLTNPSTLDSKQFAYESPLEEVRSVHEERRSAAVVRHGSSPTRMETIEDVLAMWARLKQQKDAHRAACNWITRDELLTFCHGNTVLADAVFEEVQVLLAEEQR